MVHSTLGSAHQETPSVPSVDRRCRSMSTPSICSHRPATAGATAGHGHRDTVKLTVAVRELGALEPYINIHATRVHTCRLTVSLTPCAAIRGAGQAAGSYASGVTVCTAHRRVSGSNSRWAPETWHAGAGQGSRRRPSGEGGEGSQYKEGGVPCRVCVIPSEGGRVQGRHCQGGCAMQREGKGY